MHTEDMPFRSTVEREGLYYLTAEARAAPPGAADDVEPRQPRRLARRDRRAGSRSAPRSSASTIVPETAARKLLVSGGRVVGIRTGDRGRGRDGEELPNFEPGSDIRARVTILAEGTQGHLTGVALDRFALSVEAPGLGARRQGGLGGSAAAPPRHPHDGLAAAGRRSKFREFGGSFIYPLGENMVALGMVVGLDYTDASLSVHDLLQELKGHPFVPAILEGGKRVAWGAKTIPEGGFLALPDRFHFPGGMIVGDGAGLVNVPALKGIHYAMRSGMLAAETAVEALAPGRTAWEPGALEPYDAALRESYVWKDLERVRNMRPAFKYGFMRGAILAGLALNTLGKLPPRRTWSSRQTRASRSS